MSSAPFTDETTASQKMAAGSSGSFEIGANSPSGTGGVLTVDGVALNNGSRLAAGTVPPAANNRTTGAVTLASGATSSSISTGKSTTYPVPTIDNAVSDTFIASISTTAITFQNVGVVSASSNYSFL